MLKALAPSAAKLNALPVLFTTSGYCLNAVSDLSV